MPAPAVSPIVAALDHPDHALAGEDTPTVAVSLIEALSEVPDPRKARGIRHGVLTILLLGACAVLTGARSFAAIAEYAHDTGWAILDRLGVGAVVPHESTIRRVLQNLDPDAVDAAMRTWALAQLADRPTPEGVPLGEQRHVLSLDGKTVRGAHVPTDTEKGSEVAAFTTLLDHLDLTDVLLTADAVHTNRHHADYLYERGGHYLLTAKLNQPTLLRRLRALPWTDIRVAARERGRGHGRVETRTISVVALDPCPDAGGPFFPHAAQAIKVVRRRRALTSNKWTTVTVYAITSLTGRQADPTLLARWLRGHWSIEALHWVRDVSFDEDRSQVRTGNGPQIMAALRNLVITALRLTGVTNIAAALRHHARDAHRPLATLKIT